jgi:hypothetical protein
VSRPPSDHLARDPLDAVRESLRGLRYGTIVLTIHDGVVVQVERTEKLRFDR